LNLFVRSEMGALGLYTVQSLTGGPSGCSAISPGMPVTGLDAKDIASFEGSPPTFALTPPLHRARG
jgi:hypothetical protein